MWRPLLEPKATASWPQRGERYCSCPCWRLIGLTGGLKNVSGCGKTQTAGQSSRWTVRCDRIFLSPFFFLSHTVIIWLWSSSAFGERISLFQLIRSPKAAHRGADSASGLCRGPAADRRPTMGGTCRAAGVVYCNVCLQMQLSGLWTWLIFTVTP